MRADSVAQASRLWFRSVHRRDACGLCHFGQSAQVIWVRAL